MEHLMTTEEVAEILHVDPATIRRLVNRGDLAAYRIGADYRFAHRTWRAIYDGSGLLGARDTTRTP